MSIDGNESHKAKVNELTGVEIKYQPVTASLKDKVFMITELELTQRELLNVEKSLINKG